MKIGLLGITLIKYFEQLHDGDLTKIGLQPKMCPAGIWTIGYGHALSDLNGKFLKGEADFHRIAELYPEYLTINEEIAVKLLDNDLDYYETRVEAIIPGLKQHEFDSLVSFSYNVGLGALKSSTLLKRIQSRQGNIEEAFLMWNKSGGKVLRGLTRRRQAEATLFLTGKLVLE